MLDLSDIAVQPYFASVLRAAESLQRLGHPLGAADQARLAELVSRSTLDGVRECESLLAPYTLLTLVVHADGQVTATAGSARRELVEHGWTAFLLRIENLPAIEDNLEIHTGSRPGEGRQWNLEQRPALADTVNPAHRIERLWLVSQLHGSTRLSGLELEYRVVELCSRDRGVRTARFSFGAGRGQYLQSLAEWASINGHVQELEFRCTPSREVRLRIADVDGRTCVAAIAVKDARGHVYPSQVLRFAPDMAFHPQVYRADGEPVILPDGDYTLEYGRGPEYVRKKCALRVSDDMQDVQLDLERWIDPARWGWYPGDVHIHAAGCSHFMQPTRGVHPETIIRHVRGEALSVGQVLTWGPAWDYQKQFFSGAAVSPAAELEHPELQTANNVRWKPRLSQKDAETLLRYDVEVSGFPSSICGHLILLRLRQQEFPDTKVPEDWPSWNLPIVKWAMGQGAVIGYAHCGAGMGVATDTLPNYALPTFDSVGTNEAIVDVTHGALHFIGGCELQPSFELNAWYHMLNCGFRPVFAGETDYPCIYDERPGVGRSYVRLDERPSGDRGYEQWVAAFRMGHVYSGDGRSHLLEFSVNGQRPGDPDLVIDDAVEVQIRARVAARLEAQITPATEMIRNAAAFSRPTWHLERARIADSRDVTLELVINGYPVDGARIHADGEVREVSFKVRVDRSSWVSLRIMPSSHSYPVFVRVGQKPVRASRRSGEWLRRCVDRLWEEKYRFIRETERTAAALACDHARRVYEAIIQESETL